MVRLSSISVSSMVTLPAGGIPAKRVYLGEENG